MQQTAKYEQAIAIVVAIVACLNNNVQCASINQVQIQLKL